MGRSRSLSAGLRKDVRLSVRIPKEKYSRLKELFSKHGLRGIQELFDVLVVSGIVFRNAEVIEFVRAGKQKEKDRFSEQSKAKFGWITSDDTLPKADSVDARCLMYTQDYKAFCDYIIEENIKKQWVWNILLVDGFLAEPPFMIELINKWKSLHITARKKAVVRLANDEYITTLSPADAEKILDEATREYDNRVFDASIEAMIEEKLKIKEKEEEEAEEQELDDALNKKMESLRRSRQAEVDFIVKPYREK